MCSIKGAFFVLTPVSTGAHNGPVTRSLVTIVRRMNADYSSLIRDDCIISPHAWNAHRGETVAGQEDPQLWTGSLRAK
jgi:hypothetical protein